MSVVFQVFTKTLIMQFSHIVSFCMFLIIHYFPLQFLINISILSNKKLTPTEMAVKHNQQLLAAYKARTEKNRSLSASQVGPQK